MYTPVLLPGKSHGWRSLVGCSPWGREELDTTERLHFHFSLSCVGEGNGNPLQCSCLENPRDGGAWWAAVYGVAQSRTRLKRLSSSGSSHICIHSQKGWEGKACRDLGLWWLRTFHVVALTVFVFLFYSDDDLELLPHCKRDGSFHIVHGWFTVLLTVSLQLLTIVSFDLFSGVREYYTETFVGRAGVASHQPATNTGCLVCIPLSLLSEPLHRERWCLRTSWHSCSEHVHTGEGPPAAFHGFLVRDCIWGTRDACTQECRRGHPPTILAHKPPAHLAQQPHQASPVPCCHCIGLQSLYSGSPQGLRSALAGRC